MPVQNGHLPLSPSTGAVNTLPTGNQSPNIPSKDRLHTVHNGAKAITQTTRTAVKNQGFKTLSIISWVKCIVSKCGLPGYPLVLLVSPFLVPASIIYDGFRGITLLCRKIAKIETPVEKLLPKTEKHQQDVEELLHEKTASDSKLQVQVEQLRARKGKANQQIHLLQLQNDQLEQQVNQLKADWVYRENCWQQDITASRQRAGNAEQQVAELTRKLDLCSKNMNKTDQGYQTEKTRLSSELKQLTDKLVEKDKLVKALKSRILTDENIRREEKSHLKTISQERISDTYTLQKELECRTKEIGELQKEQDKIVTKYNAQQSLWENQAKEYLNTINGHRAELDKQHRINKDAMDQLRHMELELKMNKQRYQSELGTLSETITRNKEKMKSLKLENIELTAVYQETERKLKEQLALQEAQLSNTRSRNERLSTEMQEKKQQIQTLSQEIKSAQKNHQDKAAQYQDARKQLQITISELKQALQASQSRISALQKAQQKEQLNYERLQGSVEQYQAESNDYQNQVVTLETQVATLKTEAETINNQMKTLQSRLNDSNRRHSVDHEVNEVNKVEVERLMATLGETKHSLAILQQEYNELSALKQASELQGNAAEREFREQLACRDRELINARTQSDRLSAEMKAKEQQIQLLSQKIKIAQKNHQDKEAQDQDTREQLQQKINKLEITLQASQSRISSLQDIQRKEQVTYNQIQESLKLHQATINSYQKQVEKLETEIETDERKMQNLQSQLSHSEQNHIAELEKLNVKLTEKEQQAQKLKQKIESLQTDFNELATAKQEVERQGRLTEHQLRQQLTDKEKHHSAEFERLTSELSKKEQQIQKLQQEIDEIEQRLNKSEVNHQQLEIVKSQLAQAYQNSETTLSALQKADAQLALLEVELSNARTESDRLSAEMKEKEYQIQTLSQEITRAQKKHQKREDENHEDRKHLYNTICEHEKMLQERQHQISVLQEMLKEETVNYEQLQEQAIKSKTDFVELRQDYQRSVIEMTSTITSLKEDIEQYEKQHQEYQLEIDQLNNRLKELKGAVDALRAKNNQLVTAGKDKDAEAQPHQMESQLREQYKEKITDLEGELYYQKTMVTSLEKLLKKQSIERCNYIHYLEKLLSEHETKLHLARMYPEDYTENKPEDNRPSVLRRTLSF